MSHTGSNTSIPWAMLAQLLTLPLAFVRIGTARIPNRQNCRPRVTALLPKLFLLLFAFGDNAGSATQADSESTTQIDTLVLYTDGIEAQYGAGVESRINQVISVTNKVYTDSNLDMQLRLVHTAKINYGDNADPKKALDALTCDLSRFQFRGVCKRGAEFESVSQLRDQYGADVVVLMRPYKETHGGVCGIAWIGGYGTNGDLSHDVWRETAMSVVGLDGPCPDWVTAHELGHNMGLVHGALQDYSGGTYPWAWGYGELNDFATIMAYSWIYGSGTRKVYNYSSPNLDCFGQPCGIDRNSYMGADAVHALTVTGAQVAAYTASAATEPTDNDGTSDIEELKQIWLDEKHKFHELREQKALKAKEHNEARLVYREKRKAYVTAYRVYRRQYNLLTRLTKKANAAIAAYSRAKNERTRQRLYQRAIARLNKQTAQVAVVNQAADAVNNAAAAYESSDTAYRNALNEYKSVREALSDQKKVMLEARRRYLKAKRGAHNNALELRVL